MAPLVDPSVIGEAPPRVRVAVLGGGCAGCAAAHALTRTPELRDRFEVTVYESSHRLGGKGATGRDDSAGNAVLEHGLHVWMGWYHRAFAVTRDVLADWRVGARRAPPFRTIEDAFEPSFTCSFPHRTAPNTAVTLTLPRRPGAPGVPRTRWQSLRSIAGLPTMLLHLGRDVAGLDRATRRTFAKLGSVVGRGLLRDLRSGGPSALHELDALDLRAWLAKHGGDDEVCDAPPIRAFYDLAFAYPDGISGAGLGQVAAGAALASMARIFASYRGAPFWRMRAGMGDTVFAPMYEVLRQRGVAFRFFHEVVHLNVSRGHGPTIRRVQMRRLARPRGEEYLPLTELCLDGGAVLPVWPERPLVDQLGAPGQHPQSAVLESGRDFDLLILAIPASALGPLSSEVRQASPAFDRMLKHSSSVSTRATQVWLPQPPAAAAFPPGTVMTGQQGAFASWADMTDVLPFEAWGTSGRSRPRALLYGCDVDRGDRSVGNVDLEALRAAAVAQVGRAFAPGCAGSDGGNPVHVYARRNTRPWERYCLTLPGSTRSRLGADQSGLSNLLLAGDWVRTSINGGSVEAAFEAGQDAAAAAVRWAE